MGLVVLCCSAFGFGFGYERVLGFFFFLSFSPRMLRGPLSSLSPVSVNIKKNKKIVFYYLSIFK